MRSTASERKKTLGFAPQMALSAATLARRAALDIPVKEALVAGRGPIAGVDEAGAGALAGPVVAAAVMLRSPATQLAIEGLDDSKRLSAKARARVHAQLRTHPHVAIGVSIVPNEAIDQHGVLNARLHAMARAARALPATPGLLFVDGDRELQKPGATTQTAVIGGDGLISVVAAASVVAKEVRDQLMTEAADRYPEYGFDAHMGYATAHHRERLRSVGPCPIHRRSYRPVREAEDLFLPK